MKANVWPPVTGPMPEITAVLYYGTDSFRKVHQNNDVEPTI